MFGAGAGAGAGMLPRSRSRSRSRPKMSRLRIPGSTTTKYASIGNRTCPIYRAGSVRRGGINTSLELYTCRNLLRCIEQCIRYLKLLLGNVKHRMCATPKIIEEKVTEPAPASLLSRYIMFTLMRHLHLTLGSISTKCRPTGVDLAIPR